MSATDYQVSGDHYKKMKIQPTDYNRSNHMGADEGAVNAYLSRWQSKGGVDDLRKARHHLQFIIEDTAYQDRHCLARHAIPLKFPPSIRANDYVSENNIPEPEAEILRRVWSWNCAGNSSALLQAAKCLDELIEASWVG